jgi:hypothetical protein
MEEKITSKKNKILIAILYIFPTIIFCVFGVPKIIETYNQSLNEQNRDVTSIILPFLFFVLVIYIITKFLDKFPVLIINRNGIEFRFFFKTEKYNWNEIENIEITGKKQFGKFFVTPTEATTFHFKNKAKKIFWAESYLNSSEIRQVLERANEILLGSSKSFNSLNFQTVISIKSSEVIDIENQKIFNDNHILSANGILFYGFLIFTLFIVFQNPSEIIEKYDKLLLISFFSSILCFAISSTMNYFIFTEKHLIIKNSIWFWRKKIYDIENIKEIVIDMPFRSPICLRVITKDFNSNRHLASSLKNSTWRILKKHIIERKITLRDEILI